MDLLEFQGKALFARNGVPVPPEGRLCRTSEEAETAALELRGSVVVKAQVRAGGRGKAGGIRFAVTPTDARAAAEAILGREIGGHEVTVVYVEPACEITDEYYLALMHDRVGKGYLVICSAQGGVDIEQVAHEDPDAVVKHPLRPAEVADGLPPEVARDILGRAGIREDLHDRGADLLVALFAALRAEDATLMEINPLIRTLEGELVALDAKVSLDDNAAFRHDGYAEWQVEDLEAGDPLEIEARKQGIQYVKLDGSVGVLGNGAGLVMATLDVVAQHGGAAANFLDVGGGASAEEMTRALALVLRDPDVRSVLVNIFGGITRCDEIATGVLEALDRLGEVPQQLVVRLDGTLAEEGRRILSEADHPGVVPADSMDEAAETAVRLASA